MSQLNKQTSKMGQIFKKLKKFFQKFKFHTRGTNDDDRTQFNKITSFQMMTDLGILNCLIPIFEPLTD